MDPRRKRIYFIIMAACILLSAALLYYNSSGPSRSEVYTPPIIPVTGTGTGSSSSKSPANRTPSGTSSNISGDAKNGYSAPSVFPANSNFDFSVLDSSTFKQLKKYEAIEFDPKLLGRDDPFKNY